MFHVSLHKLIHWGIIITILSEIVTVSGQIPQIPLPQRPQINQYKDSYSPSLPNISNIPSSTKDDFTKKQNDAIIREVEEHERKRNAINQQQAIQEYLRTNKIPLPDFSTASDVEHFHNSRNEILEMLEDKKKLSLKRAVFITENAYFRNKMKYEEFDATIQNLKHICMLKMQEEKLDKDDKLAKLMMIFRVLSETIEVKEPGTEKTIVHHPMKYDFGDYKAKESTNNYMVSKLLSQNTGQCHSMPLLFLILAEEMDSEAFWCFSPSHSFVKFKDKQGRWYNIELTQGAIVTDDFYMNSGFIKSKSIQTGIYLKPLTPKQTIAHMLNDLSFYYISRYDYDHFVEENSDLVLRYAPSDLTAYQLYANNCTAQAMYVINACGRPPKEQLPQYPQAHRLFNRMIQSYDKIDSLGYEDMPTEMYHNWLKQLDKAKVLPENQPSPIIQLKK